MCCIALREYAQHTAQLRHFRDRPARDILPRDVIGK